MLKKLTFIMLSFASVCLIGCNSQEQKTIKRKQLFNYDWKFSLSDSLVYNSESFDDGNWSSLDLPHDWSIEGKSEVHNPSQGDGGFYPNGLGWYRKSFEVPLTWEGQKVSIYFEGVYMNSEVFINGQSLGIQPYGYTSFNYDLTPYLKYGQDNTIAVKVDNSQQKNCRWYSGSGIYRNVWLKITNPLHIEDWGVAITTPEVSDIKSSVQISTQLKNDTDTYENMVLVAKILDQQGQVVKSIETNVPLEPNHEIKVVQDITVENPELWSPKTPSLYQAQLSLKQGNVIVDELTKNFGIRSIEFSTENGFVLNGEKVLINGGCVHHDNGSLGAAAYDRAEERKVELLKKAGFNAVRTSHNPPSEAF